MNKHFAFFVREILIFNLTSSKWIYFGLVELESELGHLTIVLVGAEDDRSKPLKISSTGNSGHVISIFNLASKRFFLPGELKTNENNIQSSPWHI